MGTLENEYVFAYDKSHKGGEKGIPLWLGFMRILMIQPMCNKMFRWVSEKISKMENRDKNTNAVELYFFTSENL